MPRAVLATSSSMLIVIFCFLATTGFGAGAVGGLAVAWLITLCPASALRLGWGLVIGLSFCEFLHVFA